MAEKRNLRLDVQGLRAIAVLAVMIAHAGLPMPGGFIGVDIFFVISGFIITLTLIREEHNTGKISFTNFFIRRFRRLAPALAVMTATTLILTLAFLSPWTQWLPAAWVGLAATFGVANYAVENVSGGYFDAATATAPFTHTWSLSVEEQFYLFFPFLLAAIFWLRKRLPSRTAQAVPLLVIAALAGVSLLSLRGLPGLTLTAFPLGYYGPIPRIFQFLAGVTLAWLLPQVTLRARWLASAVGIGGVAFLALAFSRIDESTPYPGKWAVVPAVGAVLLLWAGTQPDNPISKLLATRPLVTIGNWSYSLYLWHWPFVVLGVSLFPQISWIAVAATLISVLPAVASYRWVEQPFRTASGKRLAQRGAMLVASSVTLALIVLAAHATVWKPVLDGELTHLKEQQTSGEPCAWEGLGTIPDMVECRQSLPGTNPEVVVIGDSHTFSLQQALAQEYRRTSVASILMQGSVYLEAPFLAQRLSDTFATVQGAKVAIIITHAWKHQQLNPGYGQWLAAITAQAQAQGMKVVVLDDQPEWRTDMFECAVQKSWLLPWQACSQPRSSFQAQFNALSAANATLAATPGVVLASSFWATCDETNCYRRDETGLLYADDDHLSLNGGLRTHKYLLAHNSDYAALFQQFS